MVSRTAGFARRSSPALARAVVLALLGLMFMPMLRAHSGGEVVCKRTDVPLTVDGIPDEPEWEAAFGESSPLQDITVDPQEWYQIVAGGGQGRDTNDGGRRVSRGRIEGDGDLLVRWATLWDDEFLYFAFIVTDDSVHVYDRDYEARDGNFDGFWLLFDTRHDAPLTEFPEGRFDTAQVAGGSTYAADDHYWMFAPLTAREAGTCWNSSAVADPEMNVPENEHVFGQPTDLGYTWEVRMPWSVFEAFYGKPLVPEEGLILGFDITVMDVDGDPPGTYDPPLGGAMSWSSDFENDNSPGVLGDLIFSDEPIEVPSGDELKRGDSNSDGRTDLSDAVFTLGHLFLGGEAPLCFKTADADDNGEVQVTDAIFLLNHLFLGGKTLPPPFPDCGHDPTADGLTCLEYPRCP